MTLLPDLCPKFYAPSPTEMFQGFVRCSPDKNATGRKLLSSAVREAKKPQ
jgi:hypothetical protein